MLQYIPDDFDGKSTRVKNTRSCPPANKMITFHICYSRESEKKKKKDNNNNAQQLTGKSKLLKLERNQKRKVVFKPIYWNRTSHPFIHYVSPYSNGRAE